MKIDKPFFDLLKIFEIFLMLSKLKAFHELFNMLCLKLFLANWLAETILNKAY